VTDLQRIKKRIYDEKRIEELLELLECGSISTEQRGNLYVASLPDGENIRSVQVKNNAALNSNIRSRGIEGDIYNIVSYILYNADTRDALDSTLPRSKYWICSNLGYMEYIDEFYKETSEIVESSVPNYVKWLDKVKTKVDRNVVANTPIDIDLLKRYGSIPYKVWIEEGISYKIQKEFGIGIDVQSERVTFPIHDKYGNLIGVKGRYCGKDTSIENKYKYLYIIPCNKSLEFFNLHRALPHIKEKQEVIIVEGAKTVMLLSTWGYKNVLSIEGDSMTEAQLILLKDLGMYIKYIFAWDKDKNLEYVKGEAKRLSGRIRYAISDVANLLEGKDSPVDKGREVWETLYKENSYRIR
jgi:DNA primase